MSPEPIEPSWPSTSHMREVNEEEEEEEDLTCLIAPNYGPFLLSPPVCY